MVSTYLELGLALACIAAAGVIIIRLFDSEREGGRRK
jgi:hypothetical protein